MLQTKIKMKLNAVLGTKLMAIAVLLFCCGPVMAQAQRPKIVKKAKTTKSVQHKKTVAKTTKKSVVKKESEPKQEEILKIDTARSEGTYTKKGTEVKYISHLGFLVSAYATVNAEAKCYMVNLDIQNFSGNGALFDPKAVVLKTNNIKKNQLKALPVWAASDLKKKLKKEPEVSDFYQMASNTEENDSTDSVSVDEAPAPAAAVEDSATLAAYPVEVKAFAQHQNEIVQRMNEGYIKRYALEDKTEVSGFFAAKYVKADGLVLEFDFNGETFHFDLPVEPDE